MEGRISKDTTSKRASIASSIRIGGPSASTKPLEGIGQPKAVGA
jgi:hypothetical protein